MIPIDMLTWKVKICEVTMLDKKYRWLRNHIPEEIVFPRVENSINYPITK